MTSTSYKSIALPVQGSTTTWGDALNNGPFADIDTILGGTLTKSLSNANVALTVAESKNQILRLTGSLSADVQITTTNQGITAIENVTTGAYAVTFINAATFGGSTIGSAVTIPQGGIALVISDTTNGSRIFNTYGTAISFSRDNGGTTLTTGIQGDMQIPFNCTITSVTLLADQTGSIILDIWKDTYANYPPTVADTITSSAKPTISSAVKSTDSALTGWTKSIKAGDVLRFNIDSVTSITRIMISIGVTRS